MRRLRVLTWHTHPDYLRYLAQVPHDLHVLGANLAPEAARRQRFDCIVFQDASQYLDDQYELLTPAQRRLPKIYIEHEPPREHPVDSRHVVDAADVLVVHVSAFNQLMWNNGATPTRVIEPGVADPGERYSGELRRGLAFIDDLRGRRSGLDIYRDARARIALDPAGSAAQPAARYRFVFSPARYASMGLGLIEAMMTGLPVVALATGGRSGVIRDGHNGCIDADPETLIESMKLLLEDRELARRLGREARAAALERFGIARFVADWNCALAEVIGMRQQRVA